MRPIRWIPVLVVAVVSVSQAQITAPPAPRDPLLRILLITRAKNDQQQAQRWKDAAFQQRLATTLRDNALWLDSIVRERGWPGVSVADTDGTASASLIAQHADSTPAEQRRLLVHCAFPLPRVTEERWISPVSRT